MPYGTKQPYNIALTLPWGCFGSHVDRFRCFRGAMAYLLSVRGILWPGASWRFVSMRFQADRMFIGAVLTRGAVEAIAARIHESDIGDIF